MPAALFSTVPLRTGMSAVGTELAFILRTAFAAGPFSRRSGLAAIGTEFARILCTAFRAGPFSRRSGSGFSAVGAELACISSCTALRTFPARRLGSGSRCRRGCLLGHLLLLLACHTVQVGRVHTACRACHIHTHKSKCCTHAAFIARRRTHSVRLCVYENARPHSGI